MKEKIKGKYKTHAKIYYKNIISDAPNTYYLMDKFTMDALQAYNVLDNDNVEQYIGGSWDVYEDKLNPRIEIDIFEVKQAEAGHRAQQ